MEIEKVRTLSENFPHILEAVLKRMSQAERNQILEEFEKTYPKDFAKWYDPEVQKYLESYGR